MRVLGVVLGAVLASPGLASAAEPAALKAVVPTDGMKITKDTLLAPGVYRLENGIEIAADGVTLDGGEAILVGSDFKGAAVRAVGRKNVTIRNVTAERFQHGIRLDDCREVTVEKNKITRTAELEIRKHWLNVHAGPDAYGAGIMLVRSMGGRIAENSVEHQQNGVWAYSSSGLTIEKNNCCYQSGWGIALSDSCGNVVQDNVADFCDRAHFRGAWNDDYMGADAAGLPMVLSSCRNKVLRNKFRDGGDGIFVAGGGGPCNDNLFEENDCSLSPNNAVECTFSSGNVFRRNRANKSNYGFWLGFSTKTEVSENTIVDNRISGIAIDHGNTNTIKQNDIRGNKQGILLWSGNPVQERKESPGIWDSHSYTITGYNVASNRVGIYSITTGKGEARCYKYAITDNTFTDNRIAILLDGTNDCKVEGNTMSGNVVENIRETRSTGNKIENNPVVSPPAGNADARTLPVGVD